MTSSRESVQETYEIAWTRRADGMDGRAERTLLLLSASASEPEDPEAQQRECGRLGDRDPNEEIVVIVIRTGAAVVQEQVDATAIGAAGARERAKRITAGEEIGAG